MIAKPFRQSFWVHERILCAGQYPGAPQPDERDEKLCGLLDCGIRCVVSLMEPDEKDKQGQPFEPYLPRLTELAASREVPVEFVQLPIRDQTTPTRRTMTKILDRLDELMQKRVPTYLHCWGGHGRTGTVICCHLIRRGLAAEQAIAELVRMRAGLPKDHHPFEGGQEGFVRGWCGSAKNRNNDGRLP